jgi:type III secretion protein HrpB1
MNHKLDNGHFIGGWQALIEAAIDHHFLEDAAAVICGARALRPKMVELGLQEGRLAALHGEYLEAIQLLREAESSPTHWSNAKALIASCQIMVEDGQWEGTVDEVLSRADASSAAHRLAQCLRDGEPLWHSDVEEPSVPPTGLVQPPPSIDYSYGICIMA